MKATFPTRALSAAHDGDPSSSCAASENEDHHALRPAGDALASSASAPGGRPANHMVCHEAYYEELAG